MAPHNQVPLPLEQNTSGGTTTVLPTRSARPSDGAVPRISVVIPCYNYARYLGEAVRSVLEQTYHLFEVIIVNDGSTDDSQAVAENIQHEHPEHRIRVIQQANAGVARARNRGIGAAMGEFILPLDADDKIAPGMLEETLRVLEEHPSVSIAYTDRRDFDGVEQIVHAGEYNFSRLRYENHISYCSLYRKVVWDAVGGYRENIRWGIEDWDFWVAAGARGFHGRRIAKPLFWYRRHDTGFYQDVLKNLSACQAQIMVNNPEVYESQALSLASSILAGTDKTDTTELVSVIIPTRNRPERLRQAVQSVLDQTYFSVEIIVVNDGGQGIEDVLTGLPGEWRIVYVRLGRHRERSAARNAGIRVARGKYIAYLDDDDWYEPDHLATLVANLQESGLKVAYSDAGRVWETLRGDEYVRERVDFPYARMFDRDALLVSNYIPMLTLFHHRSCLDEVGFFDERLSTHEDWDLLIRLARRYEFLHVPRVTCAYTWRQDGTSTTSSQQMDFRESARIIRERYASDAAATERMYRGHRRFRTFHIFRAFITDRRPRTLVMGICSALGVSYQRFLQLTHWMGAVKRKLYGRPGGHHKAPSGPSGLSAPRN